MRRPVQAGILLASALAQPVIAQETIPAALVALKLPVTAGAHVNANAPPPLAFLRLDVHEAATACSAVPSLSINNVRLAADDGHVLAYDSGLGELVLRWEADCVSWGRQEREQQLRLRVVSVGGVAPAVSDDDALVVRFRQTHPVRISDVEGAASVVRFDGRDDGDLVGYNHGGGDYGHDDLYNVDDVSADAHPMAQGAATLLDWLSSSLRSAYDYLVAPSSSAGDDETADHDNDADADADSRPAVVIASTRPGPFSSSSSDKGHSKSNPFLPIFSICLSVLFFALFAITHAERRRARLAAAGLDGSSDDNADDARPHGRFRRFVTDFQRRRRDRREARRLRRAGARASFKAAVGRAGERLHQRLRQWQQSYGEKRVAGSGGGDGADGALLVEARRATPTSAPAPTPASPDAPRYSMEEDIAQFRAAADVVSQMVSAEEGRCTAVADRAKETRPYTTHTEQHTARPLRPQPPRPPRAAGYVPLDVDDADVAPPAYSPEDTSQGWTDVFAGRTGFYRADGV